MKDLIRTLVLCSALSLWTSAAQAIEHLQCSDPKCVYSEEIGPDQTKTYRGQCGDKEYYNYSMVCHAVKGTTCTNAIPLDTYWACTCTNWNATQRKNLTIDLLCSK